MNVAGAGGGGGHATTRACSYYRNNGSHKAPGDFDFSGIESAIKSVENLFDKDYGIKNDVAAAASQLLTACNYTDAIDLSEQIYNVLTGGIDEAKTAVGNILAAVKEESVRIIETEKAFAKVLNDDDKAAENRYQTKLALERAAREYRGY